MSGFNPAQAFSDAMKINDNIEKILEKMKNEEILKIFERIKNELGEKYDSKYEKALLKLAEKIYYYENRKKGCSYIEYNSSVLRDEVSRIMIGSPDISGTPSLKRAFYKSKSHNGYSRY